ncbi:MAG: hypothetical protein RLZZ126_499 [Pseudomonadota bacterium]
MHLRSSRFAFATLLLGVLALHLTTLGWLHSLLTGGTGLAKLPDPVYARLLQPSPPAALLPPPRRPAPSKPALEIPPPLAPQSAAEPSPPEPPAPDPATAEAPAPAASEPVASPSPAAEPTLADTWPPDTRLSYDVTGHYHGPVHGSARVLWQRHAPPPGSGTDTVRYQARIEVSALSMTLFTITSQGEVDEQGLRPGIYEERPPGGLRRVEFDDDTVKLQNGRRLARPPGVQDTASQLVDLSHRFSTGRDALRVGGSVQVWLARPGGVDLWTYDIQAEETIQTAEMGAVQALRLKPRPLAQPRGNITAELWFAPSLQYLPVRVRISMGTALGDETYLDLIAGRIEQAAPSPPRR